MEDNKDINIKEKTPLEKGILLLKSALRKYEEGETESADKDRELANKYLDGEMEIDDNVLYGENRNFGIIYHIIKENAQKEYNENKNFNIAGKLFNYIISNNILKEQYKIYDILENIQIKNNVDEYINEATKIFPELNKKDVIDANKKLIETLRKNHLDEMIVIDEDKINLYETIEYLLLNKKTISNIDKFNTCKNILKEHIVKNNYQEINEDIVTLQQYEETKQEKIKEISESLTEEEKSLLNEIKNSEPAEVFNKYKNEAIHSLINQMDLTENIEEKFSLNNALLRLTLKQFNENKLLEDINQFIKIKNIAEQTEITE